MSMAFFARTTTPCGYTKQSGSPLGLDTLDKEGNYLAYLDVWERHVTAYEDEDEERIGIREVALRGPDTATRAQVVWQVKARLIDDDNVIDKLTDADPKLAYANFLEFLGDTGPGSGQLRARAIRLGDDDEPCLISPQSSLSRRREPALSC